MKIIAISDLHGLLPKIDEKCDVLCICGDIIPLEIQTDVYKSKNWLKTDFIAWCNSIACEHILLIAGNHDLIFEQILHHEIMDIFLGTKIHYLENDEVEIDGKRFYGTPYCHIFGNWAFMREDFHLKMIYDLIPENLDVLLIHDAPYGTSDICLQKTNWTTDNHIGCVPLRDAILEKTPKLVLHGHLHSTNHNAELIEPSDTKVYNVSYVDEGYEPVYSPLVLEI